ncbi:dihydrofolate reductase family protein [Leucobacter tenebrionis]|uniref:dihydrofolate reductase family protein n=1 Tax=Leucobacter tenebrionis TaxID=2873270 RepID=UPI001CA7A759|nr:dihydrofolate reductase family protein [Leucobacter tenebrionis]QZY52353.1 dihydrofolate reductase family protein [Leucobacter tenebrionis]
MTRLIYYTATTLDGFLADPHDSLDWLLRQPQEEDGPGDYERFFAGIGALVMGRTTYEWVLDHEKDSWPYEIPTWVMTHRDLPLPGAGTGSEHDIRFSQRPVRDVHAEMLAAADGKDLWVVGGGDLAGQFADAGLLDEILTSIAPVVLGAGRPLLPRRLDLELVETGRNGAFVTARHRVIGRLLEDRPSP